MFPLPLNVGLIGAGRIGRIHAQHLTSRIPSARLLLVADAAEAAARQCAEQYAIPDFVQDYHAVLDNPDVQAVVICSPSDTHASIIEEAARAGKHIFCEKPIAHDLPAIDQALCAAERAGVKLQIGFNRRFDANYQRVRRAVEQGEIGEPRLLHLISRDPAPPSLEYLRAAPGLFLDTTIHDFDMVRFLTGSEVEQVMVLASTTNEDPAVRLAGGLDTAVVLLQCTNGVIGTIDNSRRAVYGYDQRVELLGSAGAIRTDHNYPNNAILSDAHKVWRDLPHYFFLERYAESYLVELNAFVDAVLHDTPVPVTGSDGRAPVLMALAAQKSVAEHRPVFLREIDQGGLIQ